MYFKLPIYNQKSTSYMMLRNFMKNLERHLSEFLCFDRHFEKDSLKTLKNIHGVMHEQFNIWMLFIIRYSFQSKGLIFTL